MKMNVKSKMSARLLALLLVVGVAPGLTGCTDDEIAGAIGGAIIGAIIVGAASGGSSDNGHHDRNDHRDDHRGRDHGRGHYLVAADADSASAKETVDAAAVEAFAAVNQISVESAQIFTDAMLAAKEGNSQAIMNLGLSHDDLVAISKYQMPAEAGVEALAKNIKAEVAITRTMVQSLIAQVAQQAKAQAVWTN